MKIHSTTVIAFIFFLTLFSKQNIAQGLYFNIGAGYGFRVGSDNLYLAGPFDFFIPYNQTSSSVYNSSNNNDTYTSTIEKVKKGLGSGLSFTGDIGYAFSEYAGAEIGISYLSGNELEAESKYNDTFISSFGTSYTTGSYRNKLTSSGRVRLMPAIRVSALPSSFSPYAKAGLLLSPGGTITFNFDESYFSNTSSSSSSYEMKSTGGLSLGFMAALGAAYKLSDNLSLCIEARLIEDRWAPTKGEITKYTEDGIDEMAKLSTKKFEFSDNISITETSGNNNPNVITIDNEYIKQSYNYSSWGINLGLKINIAKK